MLRPAQCICLLGASFLESGNEDIWHDGRPGFGLKRMRQNRMIVMPI